MEPPGDIRTNRSIDDQNFLLNAWPPAESDGSATGIESVMALIRQINGMMNAELRGPSFIERRQREEERNPLLVQAWQGVDYLDQQWTIEEKRALVSEVGFNDVGTASFKDIITSPLMNDTLWSRREHHLSLLLAIPADSREWALAEESDLDRATRSLVEVNWQQSDPPHGSLSDEIESLFRQVDLHQDGSAESLTARPPSYVRILYTPSDTDPQPFESLQVVEFLDESQPVEDGTPNDGAGHRLNRYVLSAAVRLRATPNGHDQIRLFVLDGRDIEPTTTAVYCDPDWQIGAPGFSYFLFYAYSFEETPVLTHEERMAMFSTEESVPEQEEFAEAMEWVKDVLDKSLDRTSSLREPVSFAAPKGWVTEAFDSQASKVTEAGPVTPSTSGDPGPDSQSSAADLCQGTDTSKSKSPQLQSLKSHWA